MKPISKLPQTDTTFRVLILEDDPDHAFVLQHRLQRDKGDCIFLIASDEETFRKALLDFAPQLVLTDNSLPCFNAIAALHAAREIQPAAVCILVSSMLKEEQSVEFIREGGDDCIEKEQLHRLSASVNAAFARRTRSLPSGKTERQQAKRLDLYQSYLDSSPDGLVSLDDQGYIMHTNEAAGRLLSGKDWAPSGNLIWEVFPATKESFFEAAFHAVKKNGQPLTIRMYLAISESWVDCFFQPAPPGMTVLIRDVTSEERLRAQLRELQDRLETELHVAASLASQQERFALGQELHDNVNQLLASANLFLTMLSRSPERVEELLPFCSNSVRKAIEENRRIAHGLASMDQGVAGGLEQVEQLCETMLRPAGISFELHANNFAGIELPADLNLVVYRILQEHCQNIVRHSGASRVSLQFGLEGDTLHIAVADNGRGASLPMHQSGVGLGNMVRRARDAGGHLHISTSSGNGFVLDVRLPFKL